MAEINQRDSTNWAVNERRAAVDVAVVAVEGVVVGQGRAVQAVRALARPARD